MDGACVFLNRPGFAGGQRLRAAPAWRCESGVHPLTTKPDVCWQLPVRREQEHVERPDGTTSEAAGTIGEFDRRGWGPGGADLHWWCTGAPLAHVSREPLVERPTRPELTELIGERRPSQELRGLAELRLDQGLVAPHPASPPPGPVPVELHRHHPGA